MTVFIERGQAPLSKAQGDNRGLQLYDQQKARAERDEGFLKGSPAFIAWLDQWIDDNAINRANNIFNWQLAGYRRAAARLQLCLASEGQAEILQDQPTGETDPETGAEILAPVIVRQAIAPLPATVEAPVYDPETGAPAGVETLPNPAILADLAGRAAAQAVVDQTPADVKAFDLPA